MQVCFSVDHLALLYLDGDMSNSEESHRIVNMLEHVLLG
jgi:hypothetical protein